MGRLDPAGNLGDQVEKLLVEHRLAAGVLEQRLPFDILPCNERPVHVFGIKGVNGGEIVVLELIDSFNFLEIAKLEIGIVTESRGQEFEHDRALDGGIHGQPAFTVTPFAQPANHRILTYLFLFHSRKTSRPVPIIHISADLYNS